MLGEVPSWEQGTRADGRNYTSGLSPGCACKQVLHQGSAHLPELRPRESGRVCIGSGLQTTHLAFSVAYTVIFHYRAHPNNTPFFPEGLQGMPLSWLPKIRIFQPWLDHPCKSQTSCQPRLGSQSYRGTRPLPVTNRYY